MKILINATNINKGGGVQVSASVIAEALKDIEAGGDTEWHFAVSPEVASAVHSLGEKLSNATVFDVSPARDRDSRRKLLDFEATLEPTGVFSIFGPAYVKFSAPHLCGVAYGWITHSTWLAFRSNRSLASLPRAIAGLVYRAWWLRQADRWVAEAENGARGLTRRLRIAADKVDIVPNSCASIFREAEVLPAAIPADGETLRLVYVSAYYPHKNLELIPLVARELKQRSPDLNFEFVVTLPEDSPGLRRLQKIARDQGVESNLCSVGALSLQEIVELYKSCHVCFMCSVLETFSATQPEAMALGRPVVNSDMGFNRAVCRDAASYFEVVNPGDAADKILQLVGDAGLWSDRIRGGYEVVARLPTPRQKLDMYKASLRTLLSGERSS